MCWTHLPEPKSCCLVLDYKTNLLNTKEELLKIDRRLTASETDWTRTVLVNSTLDLIHTT